ncbi:reticulon-like protein B14 [Pistacia vera]|uniref:reticulon-like protein B14 n=1 Tax=Pistacia vera TaxID=55513 RepID=UPI0012633A33|nr:reticulon-like protein B14 [Pistacia vera]
MSRESAAPGRFFDILGGGGNVIELEMNNGLCPEFQTILTWLVLTVSPGSLEILNSANCDYLFFIFRRTPHRIDEFNLSESTCAFLFGNLSWLLIKFYDISSGNDFRLFFLTLVLLWILSVIGEYFSSPSLLYFVFLCLETLPAICVRFQGEVDYLAGKSTQDMKKLFQDFNSKVLDRIPRAPTKEKK